MLVANGKFASTRNKQSLKAPLPMLVANGKFAEVRLQPLKAWAPMLVANGKFAEVRLQPLKAYSPMLVANGKFAEVRLLQPLKAELPMLVANGKFVSIRNKLYEKASKPMLVANGKFAEVRLQPLKAPKPMLVANGKFAEVRLLQPLKAELSIVRIFAPLTIIRLLKRLKPPTIHTAESGRTMDTILSFPFEILEIGSKVPSERRPPPVLLLDLVQFDRSRFTYLPDVSI